MKRQIDHFLLGLLWLLAVALGANFWFNTKFGFNIFAGSHWDYLGQLQASRIPVSIWFYISMVVIVFVMIGGLYLLIRPRFRKIRFSPLAVHIPTDDASMINITPDEPVIIKEEIPHQSVRPPKLNLGHISVSHPAPAAISAQVPVNPTILDTVAVATPDTPSDALFAEIKEIFESTGYSVKTPPRLGSFRPALFAIGINETLWIGGIGVEPSHLAAAVDKLQTIFTDTLKDIQIRIHPFIVMPKTKDLPADSLIDLFDSMAEVRQHMDSHKNPDLTDADKEDFAAYSEYIDTVTNYFNN